MLSYVLVDDVLDEMMQNISYIKLKSYFKERKKVLCQVVLVEPKTNDK